LSLISIPEITSACERRARLDPDTLEGLVGRIGIYARENPDQAGLNRFTGFCCYLRDFWGTDSWAEVSALFVRKTGKAVSRRIRRPQ
jgi:hypothetical protein